MDNNPYMTVAQKREAALNSSPEDRKTETQKYLDYVSSQVPENYREMLEKNPYLSYDYQQTWKDHLGNVFGYNTEEDRIRMQQEQAAREYAQQIQSMSFENEYNSPTQQAERMRAAGLNPDLVGATGEPSASYNEPETRMDYSGVGSDASNLAKTMFSICTEALGLAHGFVGLQQSIEDLSSKDFANGLSALGLSDRFASMFVDSSLGGQGQNFGADFVSRSLGLNKRNRAAIDELTNIYQLAMSKRSAFENDRNSAHSARQDYAERSSSQYSTRIDSTDDSLFEVVDGLVKMTDLDMKYAYKANTAKNIYDSELYEQLSPTDEASSRNETNQSTAASAQYERELNEVWREMVTKIRKNAKNGDKFSSALLLGILALRNSQFHPSISQSSVITPQKMTRNFKLHF